MSEIKFLDDEEAVIAFIRRVDKLFPIPISDKTNICEYVSKIMKFGLTLACTEAETIQCILFFYANDLANKKSYVSLVCTDPEFQGKGLASKLLLHAMNYCKEKGFEKVELFTHKTNVPAVKMYEKLGFSASESETRPDDIKFTYYLK